MHYYQFNIADYANSTQHLEPMEDLAYRRMLDLYYMKERPLPSDISEIARLIRMRSHSDCIAVVLQDFFIKSKDGYVNIAADDNLKLIYGKSDKARKAAQARWNKIKELEGDGCNAVAMQTHTDSNADGMLPITHNPLPINPLPKEKDPLSAESDHDLKIKAVITYFNKVTSSKVSHKTESHRENISARLNDGYQVEDLNLVIDFKFKEWGSDPKMASYVRPQTLFIPKNFNGYLLAAKAKPVQKSSLHDLSGITYESGDL